MKIGVSCGSNDTNLIGFLFRLVQRGQLDYVELYIRPDASLKQLVDWADSGLVQVVHCPHDDHGNTPPGYLDLGTTAGRIVQAEYAVYDVGTIVNNRHPTITSYHNNFTVLPENMPYFNSLGERCGFSHPDNTPLKFSFCLDFTHAWVTANLLGENPDTIIAGFMAMTPKHLHLSGTDREIADTHCPLDQSLYHFDVDLVFAKLMGRVGDNIRLTVETNHETPNRELAIENDLNYLHHQLNVPKT